jgi:hypothetical protein
LLGASTAAGCRPQRKDAQSPGPSTIEEAERRLAANAEALSAEGIVVPTRVAVSTVPSPIVRDPLEPPPAEDSDTDPDGPSPDPEPTDVPFDEDAPESQPPEPSPSREVDEDSPAPAAPRDQERSFRFDKRRGVRVTDRNKRKKNRTRCERVCDLAEATCDLQLQICGLAERHVTDVRYEEACSRAELQCEAAARECRACDGGPMAWTVSSPPC